MHESYKKWLEDGKPTVFCSCPCHGEITIKEHHKRFGIPKYITGGHYIRSEEIKQKNREKLQGKPKTEEHKSNLSKSHIGCVPWNKGIPWSEEIKQKNRESQPDTSGEKNHFFGKRHTEESRQKISNNHADMSGNKSPNWRGGITPLRVIIRTSQEYIEWRLQIFGRDNFTCRNCGIRGIYLEAHHIIPFTKIIRDYNIKNIDDALKCELLWNLNNGITYCTKCHSKLKKKGGLN